jgi:hypothetical protein
MRIPASNGTALAPASAPAARRTPSAGFAVSEENAPRSAAAAGSLRTVGGIDALIALQGVDGVEDPLERRKRAVKRGRLALDVLDELKIGLLGGALSASLLTKLQAAAAQLKLASGNADLDQVLGEIELRVEVEIAKLAP